MLADHIYRFVLLLEINCMIFLAFVIPRSMVLANELGNGGWLAAEPFMDEAAG